MMIRYSKIIVIAAIFLFCALAALGNISDYDANFPYVQKTLMMKELLPGSTIGYRAITNPIFHHMTYIFIITAESLTALLCLIGAWNLFRARKTSGPVFNQSKNWAVAGLTLGFLTWQVLFMSVAGEWFGIWMSNLLRSALPEAFQIFITMLGILIYVAMPDE